MNIHKISLKGNGFNGMHAHYFIEEVKNNRTVMTPVIKKPKDPIHKDLENLFKELRVNLLELCEMIDDRTEEGELKFKLLETNVTDIEFDSDGFIIHGYKETLGDKKLPLNPPKIEEIDGYDKFQDVMDIMRSIALETKQYLEGSKKVSDMEIAERWVAAGKDKSMTMETFKGLTAEEQLEFCTNFIEKQYGGIVMTPDNDLKDMDNTAAIEEMETEFNINGQDEIIVPVVEAKGKGRPKAAHSPKSEEEAF